MGAYRAIPLWNALGRASICSTAGAGHTADRSPSTSPTTGHKADVGCRSSPGIFRFTSIFRFDCAGVEQVHKASRFVGLVRVKIGIGRYH